MPPGIKSDIFEWTIGIGLYTTEDQRSNNPCLVRPGHSEVCFNYYGNPSKNPTYLSRVGSLMRSITNPRTLRVVNIIFQGGEDYQTTLP